MNPRGEIHAQTVPVRREDVEDRVQKLSDLMSLRGGRGGERPDNSGSPEVRQQQILHWLYGLLIEPIEHRLPPEQEARVIFVPHGPLFMVPFPALLDPTEQPLLVRYTLSTAPAIAILEAIHPPVPAPWASKDVLVAGNPTLPQAFLKLGDLRGAKLEAEKVAQLFGARSLTGEAATKDAVEEKLPGARLIHLAGHALPEYGEEEDFPGALIFASTTGHGLLTTPEIAELKLRADLVVLSACATGDGHITGDGVVGLARSFLAAGAKGVVVSLWNVDDRATAFLMGSFYQHLARGNDRAVALREAMRATRGEPQFQDPRQWAAFTFIGREPLPSP